VLQEVLGRIDRDGGVGLDDPEHAAEVVDVGVGVDDRGHGAAAPVLAVQGQRGRRDLLADQRVDDEHALVALDQGHVRHVEAPDLVNAVGHLVQAVLGGELGLAPQAGVGGGRAVGVQERPGHVPDHAAVGGLDDHRVERGDKAPVGVLEVRPITEISAHARSPSCGT
jgi:hypothetical protein